MRYDRCTVTEYPARLTSCFGGLGIRDGSDFGGLSLVPGKGRDGGCWFGFEPGVGVRAIVPTL